jgi:hypothetical protein
MRGKTDLDVNDETVGSVKSLVFMVVIHKFYSNVTYVVEGL